MLFLHGYLSSGGAFYRQTAYFSSYCDCFSPDLKGFGKSDEPDDPWDLSDYANDTLLYMRMHGIEKPVLVGHSFGGRIAIYLAARYPERFSGVVLTGAAGIKTRKKPKTLVKIAFYKLFKGVLSEKARLKFFSPDYRAVSPVMRQSFIKIVSQTLDSEAKKITLPTLIINGKKDRETPPLTAKKLKRFIRGSELKWIENAGHFCFLDAPFAFNTAVENFLEEKIWTAAFGRT